MKWTADIEEIEKEIRKKKLVLLNKIFALNKQIKWKTQTQITLRWLP